MTASPEAGTMRRTRFFGGRGGSLLGARPDKLALRTRIGEVSRGSGLLDGVGASIWEMMLVARPCT